MGAQLLKPVVDEVHHRDEDGRGERLLWKAAGCTADATLKGGGRRWLLKTK